MLSFIIKPIIKKQTGDEEKLGENFSGPMPEEHETAP